jgi:hypothetical protein
VVRAELHAALLVNAANAESPAEFVGSLAPLFRLVFLVLIVVAHCFKRICRIHLNHREKPVD